MAMEDYSSDSSDDNGVGGGVQVVLRSAAMAMAFDASKEGITSNNDHGSGNEDWRKYGELRRKQIVEDDEVEGYSFHLSRRVSIKKYFKLIERVRGCCDGVLCARLVLAFWFAFAPALS
jgi:hypothetical protein